MAEDRVPSPSSGGSSPSRSGRQPSEPASESRPDPVWIRAGESLNQVIVLLLMYGLGYVGLFFFQNFTASGNFEQGLALQKQRKCSDAIVKLDRALSFDKEMVAAYEARAICHWRLGHIDQALADFNVLIRLKPDAVGYTNRGSVHRLRGDLDAALADLDMAIRLEPARRGAHMRRAEALRERDDFDGALAEYDLLIARDAKEREARMARAALLRDKGDFDGAIAEYDAIVDSLSKETSPGDPPSTAFFARVATLREKGAIDAALAEVEKGIARWPEIASGYRERALIALYHTGQPAAAADDFAAAIEKGFNYKGAMMLLDAAADAYGLEVTDRSWKLAPDTPFVPAAYDLVLQAQLARMRAGTADADTLLKDMQNLDNELFPGFFRDMRFTEWPGPLLKLFLGTVTPDEVRAAAQAPGRDARHRACAADFYLAAYFQEKRLDDDARRLLQAAAEGCPVWAAERGFARAELKRLGS